MTQVSNQSSETASGSARSFVRSLWGVRYQVDPSRYYFRTNPLFETGAEQYAWMNDIVCVGQGYLVEGGIAYSISQVI